MYEKIENFIRRNDLDEAFFECEKALQLYPTNGKLHAYKGMCHWQKNEYEKAEKEFLAAYSLDPTLGHTATKRAQCLEKLRRYREAMDVVKEWLPICPNDYLLQGLYEFLQFQYSAEEHDAWEKTRRIELKIEKAR